MKLYQHPLSGPCRIVSTTAEYCGVTLEKQNIDVQGGEHRSEEYRKINPKGHIPTLEDGELKVIESISAARYICTVKGGEKGLQLYPGDKPRELAKVNEALGSFNDYRTIGGAVAMTKFWAPLMKRPTAPAPLAEAVEARFKDENDKLNTFLGADRKYLVLNRLTLADIAFVEFWINIQGIIGFDWAANYPNVLRYTNGIMEELPNIKTNGLNFVNEMMEKMKANPPQ